MNTPLQRTGSRAVAHDPTCHLVGPKYSYHLLFPITFSDYLKATHETFMLVQDWALNSYCTFSTVEPKKDGLRLFVSWRVEAPA
jgi:hypothetical protein